MKQRTIWVGFDPRESAAFGICRHSINRHLRENIPIRGLVLRRLILDGLYTRPMEWRPNAADKPSMWDVISGAQMSTQHANARFLVPLLAKTGWALFCDGDMLFKDDVGKIFDALDDSKAVYCVKHNHKPTNATKMDGQQQVAYPRKNWSSFMVFNCDHAANAFLSVENVNKLPGRDLHRFCWLDDNLIGELSPEWNFLVGYSDPSIQPKCVHFTEGLPDMPGYENTPFADEWRDEMELHWAL